MIQDLICYVEQIKKYALSQTCDSGCKTAYMYDVLQQNTLYFIGVLHVFAKIYCTLQMVYLESAYYLYLCMYTGVFGMVLLISFLLKCSLLSLLFLLLIIFVYF